MPSPIAFVVAIALAFQSAPPKGPPTDPAGFFDESLRKLQELVQKGDHVRADKLLDEILEVHEGAEYAKRRRLELVELAKRCAFLRQFTPPKLAQLISGELVKWDARTGDIELRYAKGKLEDFEKETDDKDGSALYEHPAVFVDGGTIEIETGHFEMPPGAGPEVLLMLGDDEFIAVCFGTPVGADDKYAPPQIYRSKGGKQEVVAEQKKPAADFGDRNVFKVVVNGGGVSGYRDGKLVLQAKRSSKGASFAFTCFPAIERVTLRGHIQPAWSQGLVDAETQKQREAFEKRWKPESDVPAWLLEAPAAAAGGAKGEAKDGAKPKGGAAGDAPPIDKAFVAALAKVVALEGWRSLAEIEGEWRQLVALFPKESEAWLGLASVQMRLGRLDDAQATCDRALAGGIDAGDLDELPRAIAEARNGPAWTRAFECESANYVVKSDIDRATCVEASQRLEESYRAYGLRLAPVPGLDKKKFVVFIFSGKASFAEYARAAELGDVEDVAGLYSPYLKQLLIWNLPDRAAMFRTIRHEGFHQYLDRLADDPATWFNEGLAEYFESADLFGGEWKEGQVDSLRVAELNRLGSSWIPLAKLFALDDDAFYGDDVDVHYSESWAVLHWMRQDKEGAELFKRLWKATLGTKSWGLAMKEALEGADVAAIERAVRAHLRSLAK